MQQFGPKVAVTAWGLLTPLGDMEQTWAGLLGGRVLTDHGRVEGGPERNRAGYLAHTCAKSLLSQGLQRDAALVVGTSKGPVLDWLGAPRHVSPEGIGQIAGQLATDLGLSGPHLTLSAACASGLHALIRATLLIRSGQAHQVLVVATEASVHPLFLGSFQRLGVLPRTGQGCRPFDQQRDGFLMSEAAAAVLLEATDVQATGTITVDRFALGGDAVHLTGSDPDGKLLRHLLEQVLDGRPVDLVHGHGTGTAMNDLVELAALESCLAAQALRPLLYSHKGALGHSLGAAGLVSIALNCQCHQTGMVPPNAATRLPLPATRLEIHRQLVSRPIRRSLSLAAGFGGPVAVVALREGP